MMSRKKDPYGSRYKEMRPAVLARNNGICAYCGIQPATDCHHGMVEYPDHTDLKEDNLVQLCEDCHDFITSTRKWCWRFSVKPKHVFDVIRAYWKTLTFKLKLRKACGGRFEKIETAPTKEPEQAKRAHFDKKSPPIETAPTKEPEQAKRAHFDKKYKRKIVTG